MDPNVVLIPPTHVETKVSFAEQDTMLLITKTLLVKQMVVLITPLHVANFSKRLVETKTLNAVQDKLTNHQALSVMDVRTDLLTAVLTSKQLVTTKMLYADQVTMLLIIKVKPVMDV